MDRKSNVKVEFIDESGHSVRAERYTNPDGTAGGWVAVTAVIEDGAVIEPGAIVPPDAHIKRNAKVHADKILSVETDR